MEQHVETDGNASRRRRLLNGRVLMAGVVGLALTRLAPVVATKARPYIPPPDPEPSTSGRVLAAVLVMLVLVVAVVAVVWINGQASAAAESVGAV